MTAWRTIVTDSESLTGVAPVCVDQNNIASPHGREDVGIAYADPRSVHDCCPHPHIETWDERIAAQVAEKLTAAEAEVCS